MRRLWQGSASAWLPDGVADAPDMRRLSPWPGPGTTDAADSIQSDSIQSEWVQAAMTGFWAVAPDGQRVYLGSGIPHPGAAF